MCNKLLNTARLGSICVLLISSSPFAMSQRLRADKEGAVRELISKWIDAYQHLDAKQVAKLETPDMETVDRFGELHVPSGRDENEKLWSDSFEVISGNAEHPVVTIDHIRLIRPDVAIVQIIWRYPNGILLVDGERLPPFSQADTFVVIKSHGTWLVAAHNMQEKKDSSTRSKPGCDEQVSKR